MPPPPQSISSDQRLKRSTTPDADYNVAPESEAERLRQINLALREEINGLKRRKNDPSPKLLGRGIKKVASLFDRVQKIVQDCDNYIEYMKGNNDAFFEHLDEKETAEVKQRWRRNREAYRIIKILIPKFQETIDAASYEEYVSICDQLDQGATIARGADIHRMKAAVADWLNTAYPGHNPPLTANSRYNRGIYHDTTGRLLCPIDFDWDNENIRMKLRSMDFENGLDFSGSLYCRCFYAGYNGDPTNVARGFLKSPLLLKAYKLLFTSPLSTDDITVHCDENVKPRQRQRKNPGQVATRKGASGFLFMNDEVTPRSIAYTCVQLHFSLSDAGAWSPVHAGFNYKELYDFVIDYFEDPSIALPYRTEGLLKWWTRQIFPNQNRMNTRTASANSRQKLRTQRALQFSGGASDGASA